MWGHIHVIKKGANKISYKQKSQLLCEHHINLSNFRNHWKMHFFHVVLNSSTIINVLDVIFTTFTCLLGLVV